VARLRASVVGYYDLLGYDNLLAASGWDAVKLTANVQDEISSPPHNVKYDPTPDDASLPHPPKTSIACWFETSVDPLQYGWSYLSCSDNAFEGYITSRGYQCDSWYESYGSGEFTWSDLVSEIDAGRPLMFLVDTDADSSTDHFVPVFGYDDRGAGGRSLSWRPPPRPLWHLPRPSPLSSNRPRLAVGPQESKIPLSLGR